MLNTSELSRLVTHAEHRQWRLALVGDPHQLRAVGRGGMFLELCDTGRRVESEHLHRFTNRWEAAASLELRRGNPSHSTHTRRTAGSGGDVRRASRHDYRPLAAVPERARMRLRRSGHWLRLDLKAWTAHGVGPWAGVTVRARFLMSTCGNRASGAALSKRPGLAMSGHCPCPDTLRGLCSRD